MNRIAPCLWFDHQAEEAATFYVSVFKNSKITNITRYGKAGFEIHHRPAGSVMTVEFELDGEHFTQQDIDYYWDQLSQGGDPKAQKCGWLNDRNGLSCPVIPHIMPELFKDQASAKAQCAMEAMLRMKKINIAELEQAATTELAARR